MGYWSYKISILLQENSMRTIQMTLDDELVATIDKIVKKLLIKNAQWLF